MGHEKAQLQQCGLRYVVCLINEQCQLTAIAGAAVQTMNQKMVELISLGLDISVESA